MLHWAAVKHRELRPLCLLQEAWPQGTNQAGDKAVQTPLRDGRHASISFPEASTHRLVPFAALCCPVARAALLWKL